MKDIRILQVNQDRCMYVTTLRDNPQYKLKPGKTGVGVERRGKEKSKGKKSGCHEVSLTIPLSTVHRRYTGLDYL